MNRIPNDRLCSTQVMVDLPYLRIHFSVQLPVPLCKFMAQFWLSRASGVEVNLARNGTVGEDEKIRSANGDLYTRCN